MRLPWARSRRPANDRAAACLPPAEARLLVIGHCTAGVLQAVMQLLDERFEVSFLTIPELRERFPDDAAQARFFSGYAKVFLEHSEEPAAPVPAAVADRVIVFPPLFFYGLHPDLVYVWHKGKPVKGPLDDYHSSIAVWGYLHGLSPERVVRLFRAEVYEALGFFGMFEESFDHLVSQGRERGFELRPLLVRWLRRGAFMHSVNHPRSFALEDLARELLARFDPAGAVRRAEREVADLMPDLLANGPVFPVYPEIGQRLGIRGEYVFKPCHDHGRRDSVAPRRLTLEQFVAGSHAVYAAIGAGTLTCTRLEDPRYARLAELEGLR
jgi:hypothetical protein